MSSHETAHRPGERAATTTEQALQVQVRSALDNETPLNIHGGQSKAFLGRPTEGLALDTREHRGLVSYDPTELVVTVRAGTPVTELLAALDEQGQALPCEPATFGGQATVGGMLACGLAGPRRPWVGSIRDFVLGTKVITGQGSLLRFGGEVMKNVAGYDLSRLMAGSYGLLGVVTEVSMKVLPKPITSAHLDLDISAEKALQKLAEWGQQPLPITGACYAGQRLKLRLEGGEGSVRSAADRIGGEPLDAQFWQTLNERQLDFFADERPLWRLSVPTNTPWVELPGEVLLDWGGCQRWLKTDAPADDIFKLAASLNGHASCQTPGITDTPFQPLTPLLAHYHRQLKAQLDPKGIFNPGRTYPGI